MLPHPEEIVLYGCRQLALDAGFLPGGRHRQHQHMQAWWPSQGAAERQLCARRFGRVTVDSSARGLVPDSVRQILKTGQQVFRNPIWLET